MNNTDLKLILPKLLPGVLAALVGAPTNDAVAEGNYRRADEQLKQLKSLFFAGQQADGGSLGVLVGYLADVLVAAHGHWREGPHQVPVVQLERPAVPVVDCLRMSKLLSFPYGANVTVRDSSLECDSITLSLA